VGSTFGRFRLRLAAAVAAAATVVAPGLTTAHADTRTFTGVSVTRDGQGYALVSDAGEVYAYGTAQYRGNPVGFTGKIVGISLTGDGLGYATISSAGQVYAYGTVIYRGNPAGFTGNITGISVTADGQGYVAISEFGQVYAYGTVAYRGNPTGFTGRMVGISVTADGQGYVAISDHGQVYAYNVPYRGNPTGYSGSIAGVSVTPNGQGYVAISSQGQVYAYNAGYFGNPSGYTGAIAGVAVTENGQGYAAMSSIGQVYAYGNVRYRGNGDPGATTAAAPYAFVLPKTSIQYESWLTKPHHDYPAADVPVGTGTPFYAVTSGSATRVSDSRCGNGIVLAGQDGVTYTYCHASSLVAANGAVSVGQLLGYSGSTGSATGPHLHFQLRFGVLRCPQTFLDALWKGAPVPDPHTLPTSGCTY
jgi:murein DD-endopeptidase MepM/ murein hydrolase activator NlpD